MTDKVRERAQGNNVTGQTTLDRDQRKLEKSEAGFQEDGGIDGLRCGECYFFEGGSCRIVEGEIDADDVCDQFEPARERGSMTADQAAATGRSAPDLPTLDMFIYRVSENKQTGERRWYATASGIDVDKYGERMSVRLFKDFVRRAESQEPAPEPFTSKAWNGGLPYLSVAHYLDLEGFGIVGPTDKIWVDGSVFKAKGRFDEDSELAQRAYRAIKADDKNGVPDDERVRISIAFVDWEHEHEGRGVFRRKSLAHSCKLCAAGIGDKVYKKGHLVHLALTRRPAYEETEITLEERSDMTTKREDAASIVGEDMADELEERQQKLTSRSEGVAPDAIVTKDDDDYEGKGHNKATGTKAEVEEETVERSKPLNGAVTLDEAEAALSQSSTAYLDRWGVLRAVLTNIAGQDKAEQVGAVLEDFQSQVDVMAAKSVIRLNEILEAEESGGEGAAPAQSADPSQVERTATKEADMPENETPDLIKEAFGGLEEAVNEALETPLDRQSRLAMIQPALEGVGEAIQRTVAEADAQAQAGQAPAGGVDAETLRGVVENAIAPLRTEIAEIKARDQQVERSQASAGGGESRIPAARNLNAKRRAQRPPASVQRMSGENGDEGKPSQLKSIVRKSVGLES